MLCKNSRGANLKQTKAEPDPGLHQVTREEDWFHLVFSSGILERSGMEEINAKHKWLRHMAESAIVNPAKLDEMHSWLSAKLAQTHANLGLDPRNLSEAGKIRANLQDAKRVGNSLVNTVVRYREVKAVKQITEEVRKLGKSKGLAPEAVNRVFRDVVEIGLIPEKTYIYGSTAARAFNERRYTKAVSEWMKQGFTQPEVDRLVSLATEYADVQTKVRQTARDLGVDIGDLEGIGYFTRVFSEDMKFLMDNHPRLSKDMEEVQNELRSGYTLFSSVFNKLRTSNHYIPENTVAVAEYLSKATGDDITAAELDDLLVNDPIALRQLFHEKLSPEALDSLVESGMLNKLPMTSTELTEYLVKQYELPIKGLNSMFLEDPVKALEVYSKSLADAAGQSAMFSYMNRFGVSQGWAVGAATMKSTAGDTINGIPKKDFVQIEDGFLRGAGIDPTTIRNKSLYLHKVAAEQLKAVLFLSASPAMMDNFSQFVVRMGQFMRKSILGQQAWKYAARVILGNNIAGLAGSKLDPRFMANLIPSFSDVLRIYKNGTSHLDDTKEFVRIGGVSYTQKAAMEQLLLYRASEAAPLTPGDPVGRSPILGDENWKEYLTKLVGAANPRTWARALHFAQAMRDPSAPLTKQAGKAIGDVFKYEWKAIDQGFEQWLAPFTVFANVSDIATRWNMMQQLGRPNFATAAGQEFKTMQELFQYMDDYIPSPDDSGTFTKVYGSLVRPFALYSMFNPPAQLRHVFRYPLQYSAYHKLLALVDKAGTQQCGGGSAPEGSYASYQLDGYPITVGCDGRGMPIVFDPKNYDPLADTFVFAREGTEGVVKLFGGFMGSSAEQRDQLTTNAVQKMFEDFVGDSYYKGIYELLANRDTFTGGTLDERYPGEEVSFLGLPMSRASRHLLEQVPLLEFVNSANPGKVFGQAEKYDAQGRLLRSAIPSFIGARRTDKDNKSDDLRFTSETQQAGVKLARNLLGANLTVVDTAVNMQYTEKDLARTLDTLKSDLNKAVSAYESDYFKMGEDERKRKSEAIKKTALHMAQLNWELGRVQRYMVKNKIPPNLVFQKLNELQRTENQKQMYLSGAQFPEQEVANKVLNEYMEMLQRVEDTGDKRK